MGNTATSTHTNARILVIGGDSTATSLVATLGAMGHVVTEVADAATAIQLASTEAPDLILVDASQAAAIPAGLDTPALLIGTGRADNCVGRIAANANLDNCEAVVALATALHSERLQSRDIRRFVGGLRDGSALAGNSPSMRRLHGAVRRAADGDFTVLIEGHPGTGKSITARVIHCKSRRANRPCSILECAGTDAEALTRTLRDAGGTTLILEDIEKLNAAAQGLLVKHLKERPAQATDRQPRIIATTSAHLPELVANGAFREDLYYRLSTYPMVIPTLRERSDDIGLLAQTALDESSVRSGARGAGFTPAALVLLESLNWPGNVAQLFSVVQRAHANAGAAPIDRVHLASAPANVPGNVTSTATGSTAANQDSEPTEDTIRPFEEEEQRLLGRALRATRGNVRRAAQLLGIGRATLYRKIQQYKLRLQ